MIDALRQYYDARALARWGEDAPAPQYLVNILQAFALENAPVALIGVGGGALALHLLERGACVTLADVSPVYMARARERIEAAGLSGRVGGYIMAHAGDLARLPQGFFALTLCPGRVLNARDMAYRVRALSNMKGVTRKGGDLLAFADTLAPEGPPQYGALAPELLRVCAVRAGLGGAHIASCEGAPGRVLLHAQA